MKNQKKTNPKTMTTKAKSPIVGHANESDVLISGVKCKALIDTGSMVTTISSSFHKDYLSDHQLSALSNLRVEGADGNELPYTGFIECSIVLPNNCVEGFNICVPILVVADTQHNSLVPLVIGTNVILPAYSKCVEEHGTSFIQAVNPSSAWRLAYLSMVIRDRNNEPQLITTEKSITVPGGAQQQVKCYPNSVSTGKSLLMVEDAGQLPGSLLVVPGVVDRIDRDKKSSHVLIDVVNISSRDIIIPQDSVICSLQPVSIVDSSTSDSDCDNFLQLFNFDSCQDHLDLQQLNKLQE